MTSMIYILLWVKAYISLAKVDLKFKDLVLRKIHKNLLKMPVNLNNQLI